MSGQQDSTHFGYRDVPVTEKTRLVGEVFDSVADKYDIMNDLMSMGVHRLWKRHFVATSGIPRGSKVLDLASGTGDIAALLHKHVGAGGEVTLSDINPSMLGEGRRRMENKGIVSRVNYALANAESLPFPDKHFDAVTIAFGLRNVTRKSVALAEMHRVLKPGGRVLILEFSRVKSETLEKLYDLYSFSILPKLGGLVASDEDSYRYLAESIRKHPDQETLAQMMREAGFEQVSFRSLNAGIVAIHRGFHV
jgi:demethylmenaquinone methyltransferase/2-methoxy-6-polyprenyl-1,4-benzoquinol methylase